MSQQTEKPPLVVTTCSAGKRCRQTLHAEMLPKGGQSAVARAWLRRLSREKDLTAAPDLYRGRAFGLAMRAAEVIGADFGVVSAGLGYVKGKSAIPSYDLTLRVAGPGSVVSRVTGRFDPVAWWRSMLDGHFSSDFLAHLEGRSLILICLSRSYAGMVCRDLATFAAQHPRALRIFGLSIATSLPEAVRPMVLPYDERLERIGPSGTRVDFPQRALMHYVSHVLPKTGGNLVRDREVVARCLAEVQAPMRIRRQNRVDDAAIKLLIGRALQKIGPNRSRVLNHLRHVDGVSCEQRRFTELYSVVCGEVQP